MHYISPPYSILFHIGMRHVSKIAVTATKQKLQADFYSSLDDFENSSLKWLTVSH